MSPPKKGKGAEDQPSKLSKTIGKRYSREELGGDLHKDSGFKTSKDEKLIQTPYDQENFSAILGDVKPYKIATKRYWTEEEVLSLP